MEIASKKMLDLGPGYAIYKVGIDALRERNKNARVMDQRKFQQLAENIKETGAYESLPLCRLRKREDSHDEFDIISGHHRVRAARKGEITELYIIAIERELSEDEMLSKQLSHNALQGSDDAQILKEMYEAISTIEARLKSGIIVEELKQDFGDITPKEIDIQLKHNIVHLAFLSDGYTEYEDLISQLFDDQVDVIVGTDVYKEFLKTISKIRESENIRNITAVICKMIEIVRLHYERREPEKKEQKKTKRKK